MITGNLSKEEIKRQIEDIRLRRKLSEMEKIKAIRKQFAEELSIVHDALDSSISGVIITNLAGKIIYVNNTFLRIFDYGTKNEVLGKHAVDLFVEDRIKKLSDVMAIIDKAEGDVEEFAARRKDGDIFPVEVSSSNVTDGSGKVVGRMASFFDISKRKRAEEEKKRLEMRLHEAQKLENISTRVGEVTFEIDHTLKRISECIELIKTNCEAKENLNEYFQQIETAIIRMSQLTSQLILN
jgi:PAS domain S-box-containing protein